MDETSYDGPSSSNNVADYMQKQEVNYHLVFVARKQSSNDAILTEK